MKVLVPVAHGSESLETVTLVNVLRRAELEVVIASIEHSVMVVATRGIRLTADALFVDVREREFDLIVLPGGEKGAMALGQCAALIDKLRVQRDHDKYYAAICAAPAFALAPNGLLLGRRATCYPNFRDHLPQFVDDAVVQDGRCITSQGPATAMAFALRLVELLCGAEKAGQVGAAMLLRN